MSKLKTDLEKAFTIESKANMIYIDFAEKAEREGYKQVARLFRAAAKTESIHAHNHLRAMEVVKSTKDNLQVAAKGEVNKCKTLYPSMMAKAKIEGDNWARKAFYYASEVEESNISLFKQALDNFDMNKKVDYYICKVCGLIVQDELPEKCPICGSRKKVFKKID